MYLLFMKFSFTESCCRLMRHTQQQRISKIPPTTTGTKILRSMKSKSSSSPSFFTGVARIMLLGLVVGWIVGDRVGAKDVVGFMVAVGEVVGEVVGVLVGELVSEGFVPLVTPEEVTLP